MPMSYWACWAKMKRELPLILIIILIASAPALCPEMPKDVPENSPAYDAITDLVDRGIDVTQGYPDGTFKGSRYTTKYDICYLMAQLAISFRKNITPEVDTSALEAEIEWLRQEIRKLKEAPENKKDFKTYGSAELRSGFGSIVSYDPRGRAPLGPETNYRLKYTVEKAMGNDSSFKLNLDTMDGGFNSATLRSFATRLFDFEGNITADIGMQNPVRIKAIVGPGTVYHRDASGVMPSDDYTVFSRPKTSFLINTLLNNYEMGTGYVARGVTSFGNVSTTEIFLSYSRVIGELPMFSTTEWGGATRYIFSDLLNPPSGPTDFRQEISLAAKQGSMSEKLLFGASGTDHPMSQFYLNFECYLKDFMDKGTDVSFLFNSVGDDYRMPFEEFEFMPNNLFNRRIFDGTTDIGLMVARPISENFKLTSRSEWVGNSRWEMSKNVPGASFTQEFLFEYLIQKDLIISTYYRYYHVPSRIGQFGIAVPEFSDLLGIGLKYQF